MKRGPLIFCLFVACVFPARASNISVADFSGTTLQNPITFQNGSSMPNGGGLIRIGYFNTAAQGERWLFNLRSTNYARVRKALQSFIPLGENVLTPNLGEIPAPQTALRFTQRQINGVLQQGRLAGQITNVVPVLSTPNSVNPGGVPAGSRLFLLVYAFADGNVAGPFGVFSADNWLMPADPTLPLQLNTTDVDRAAEVFVGTFGPLGLRAVVPEPASGTMALAIGIGLISLRRRRLTLALRPR
jgi:hypothetical protein